MSDRAELAGGDYLVAVPPGGDAYVLSHVVHQIDDADAVTVLGNVRAAMAPDGQVILVDLPTEPERRRLSVRGDFDLQSHRCRRNANAAPRLSAYEIAIWFCGPCQPVGNCQPVSALYI